jgi:hypothetical protein
MKPLKLPPVLFASALSLAISCISDAKPADLSCTGSTNNRVIKVNSNTIAYPLCETGSGLAGVAIECIDPDNPKNFLGSRADAIDLLESVLDSSIGSLKASASISNQSAGRSSSSAYYERGVVTFESRHDESQRRIVAVTFWPFRQQRSPVESCTTIQTEPVEAGITRLITPDGVYITNSEQEPCGSRGEVVFFGAGPVDKAYPTPERPVE